MSFIELVYDIRGFMLYFSCNTRRMSMSVEIWSIIGIIAVLCVIGSILEVRFVLRRRDHRRSEELNDVEK